MAQRSNWTVIYKIDESTVTKNTEVTWVEIITIVPRNKSSIGVFNIFGLIDRSKLVNLHSEIYESYNQDELNCHKEFTSCGKLHFDPCEWDLGYFQISSRLIRFQDAKTNYVDYNLVCNEPVVIALKDLIINEFPELDNMVILYHINNDEKDFDVDRQLNSPEIFARFKNWRESRNSETQDTTADDE
jgi:hypothetical protein